MESIYAELALYGSKKECARTDNVFFPISEVCNGTVSLSDEGVCRTALATPGLLKIQPYWGKTNNCVCIKGFHMFTMGCIK